LELNYGFKLFLLKLIMERTGSGNYAIQPGVLEVFCGPMKSGKSFEVLKRVEKLRYMSDADFVFFKPKIDVRDEKIKSRFGNLDCECILVDEKNPFEICRHVLPKHKLVVIEEAQFFDFSIVGVINELLNRNINVVVSGLDLDFRGEPFGVMKNILSLANEVTKLTGICDVKGCNKLATRTQRLVNGAPASYDEPIISIEGKNKKEIYECRCRKHHVVPWRDMFINTYE